MAEQEQNQDLKKISAEQERLEVARKASGSPKELKERLSRYRNIYIDAVQSGVVALNLSAKSFQSKEAKDYLSSSASELHSKIAALADEGQGIYKRENVSKTVQRRLDSSGKPVETQIPVEAEKYPTLAALKEKLSSELNSEKVNLPAIRQLEQARNSYELYNDLNNKRDAASTTTNLAGTITRKNNWLKAMELASKSVTSVAGEGLSGNTLNLKNNLQKNIDNLKNGLTEDLEIASDLLAGQTELKKQRTSIDVLHNSINRRKGRFSDSEYNTHLADLKAKSSDFRKLYQEKGPGYIQGMKVPFLENINRNYYERIYQPVSDKLQGLYVKLEEKHSAQKVVEDPEKQANLNSVEAKSQFTKQNAELFAIEKELTKESRDGKKYLDPDLFEKIQKRLDAVGSNLEKINNTFQIEAMSADTIPLVATIGKELLHKYFEPALARLKNVLEKAEKRKADIDAFRIKTVNEKLKKDLEIIDKNWDAGINKQKQFLSQPSGHDENSREFKDHQVGETKIFNFLISTESQIENFLSQKPAEKGLDAGMVKRYEEYRKLCTTYLEQIVANRTYRGVQKAASKEQNQDHSYKVKIGTKTVNTYVRDPNDPEVRILVPTQEDVFEERKDTYKFTELVEFIDPNSPDYAKINDGKGWRFKKNDLPQSIQDRFAVQAGKIITEQKAVAQQQAFQDKNKAIVEKKLFDRAREGLKPYGEKYFAAIETLANGNTAEAIKLYQEYINAESLIDAAQKGLHKPYLDDARHQIEVQLGAAEFYEGMKLMQEEKLDKALPKLRSFIEKIQKLPEHEQNKFSAQIEKAVETLRTVNTAKVSMLSDLFKDLTYAEAVAIAGGNPSKADNADPRQFAKMKDGQMRDLLLPYIPAELLTPADKKKIAEGKAGLQGPQFVEINHSIKQLREAIEKGVPPVNFEEEYAKIKIELAKFSDPKNNYVTAHQYTDAQGEKRVDCAAARLMDMFDKINTTDTSEREKGFLTVANYFKDEKLGMQYTQKYLGKAMHYQYIEFEKQDKGATKNEVRTELLADPQVAAEIRASALRDYKRWVEEENASLSADKKIKINPPDAFVFQRFQTQIFESRFKYEYERKMRHKMTEQGQATKDSALDVYNWSLPYEVKEANWMKLWELSHTTEDGWNQFKEDAQHFAIETAVTLPIGMGAGAIGKAVGTAGLRMLLAEGVSEAAVIALEQGGIRAVLSNPALYKGLSPAMKMAMRARAGVAFGGGLLAEGSAMLVMNSTWEGLSTGHNPEFFEFLETKQWKKASFAFMESIAKAGAFRAIGAGQQTINQKLVGNGVANVGKRVGSTAIAEAFSGLAGTSIEAYSMYDKTGHVMSLNEWISGVVRNAVQAGGTHLAHSAPSKPKIRSEKKLTATFKKAEGEVMVERLGVKKPSEIGTVVVNSQGEIFLNGQKFDTSASTGINLEKLPPDFREALQTKIAKARIVADFEAARINSPEDIASINPDGTIKSMISRDIPMPDPKYLPENFRIRLEKLRREAIKQKFDSLKQVQEYIDARYSLQQELLANPDNQEAKTKLATREKLLLSEAQAQGLTLDQYIEKVKMEARLYKTLNSIYVGEHSLYHDSKVIKKPKLDDEGVSQRIEPEKKTLLFDIVNLFKNYETKASAHSSETVKSINYEKLVAEGGFKLIKIGGDELVVFHAAADGVVQKLFIDISNMGPANDTALNINGSRINLVDIFLFKISEHMKAQSKINQNKPLNQSEFKKGIEQVSKDLFDFDRGPNGEALSEKQAQEKFDKLKAEWNLKGEFKDYKQSVISLRALAEYRADTRSLAASFKETKGIPFDQHITRQIEQISGLSLPEIQQLISQNRGEFVEALKNRAIESKKLIVTVGEEVVSKPPTINELLDNIANLKAGESRPEELMILYNALARLNVSKLSNPSVERLTANLQKTRSELIGEPPHPRVEEPRIMDGKIVLIDLPPSVNAALQKMDPIKAQAILSAARSLSEHSLESQKYLKSPEFARFNIFDHIDIVGEKIVIKPGAKEFKEVYKENLRDKKVPDIAQIEKALRVVKAKAEQLHQNYKEGKLTSQEYLAQIRKVEKEFAKIENRISHDPDTGAYKPGYLDLSANNLFKFGGKEIIPQYRIWHSVTTDIGHAGAINSNYKYIGLDKMMEIYHKVLQEQIAKVLPADLAHFKIIRPTGGKFEIIFVDQRSIQALENINLTPESLIENIVKDSAQQAIDAEIAKDPEAKAKAETDVAVRNSLAQYVKGGDPQRLGELTVSPGPKIGHVELNQIYTNPDLSARALLGIATSGKEKDRNSIIPSKKATILPPPPSRAPSKNFPNLPPLPSQPASQNFAGPSSRVEMLIPPRMPSQPPSEAPISKPIESGDRPSNVPITQPSPIHATEQAAPSTPISERVSIVPRAEKGPTALGEEATAVFTRPDSVEEGPTSLVGMDKMPLTKPSRILSLEQAPLSMSRLEKRGDQYSILPVSSEKLVISEKPLISLAESQSRPKFTAEQLKTPQTHEEARDQLLDDARRILFPKDKRQSVKKLIEARALKKTVEKLIETNDLQKLSEMLEEKAEYRDLTKQRRKIFNEQLIETAEREFTPEQKAVLLQYIKDGSEVRNPLQKIRELSPELIDIMLKADLDLEYRDKILSKDYLVYPGADLVILSSEVLGAGGAGEVKVGLVINKNEKGEYVTREIAVKKPHDNTPLAVFESEIIGNNAAASFAKKDNLLSAIFAGNAKNGSGGVEPIITTEVVRAKPEYNTASLLEISKREQNPVVVVDGVEKLIAGLQSIHENGFMHLDAKLSQATLGTINGESAVRLGDLALIKAEDLKDLRIYSTRFKHEDEMSVPSHKSAVPDTEKPDNTTSYYVYNIRTKTQIPTTPSYIAGFKAHLQKAIDYANAHPGEKIPQHIVELPDKGGVARMIERYVARMSDKLGTTPQSKKLFQDLDVLAKRLADPDDSITLAEAREDLAEISGEYNGKPRVALRKAKYFDPSAMPEGTVLADGTIYQGTAMVDGVMIYRYTIASAHNTYEFRNAPLSNLPEKLSGTKFENSDRVTVEKIYDDLRLGINKIDLNNPEQLATLKIKLKPQDFTALQNNPELPPQILAAVIKGGRDFAPGLRVYNGRFLAEGSFGDVSDLHYIEASTGKIKTAVIKIPHKDPRSQVNFRLEVNAARENQALPQSDPRAKHLIKTILALDDAIIYEKASDASGKTTNLEESINTIPIREWLSQFAGGVEGLVFMHENGLAHNDVKPANITLGPEGGVLIDLGAQVSTADIASGRVQIRPQWNDGSPLAHHVHIDERTGQEFRHQVQQDMGFNNPYILAEVIKGKLPLDVSDKFAVGRSIAMYLETKRFADAAGNLLPNAPPQAMELRDLAALLLNSDKHPYKKFGNSRYTKVDPNYIDLATVPERIKYIANKF